MLISRNSGIDSFSVDMWKLSVLFVVVRCWGRPNAWHQHIWWEKQLPKDLLMLLRGKIRRKHWLCAWECVYRVTLSPLAACLWGHTVHLCASSFSKWTDLVFFFCFNLMSSTVCNGWELDGDFDALIWHAWHVQAGGIPHKRLDSKVVLSYHSSPEGLSCVFGVGVGVQRDL